MIIKLWSLLRESLVLFCHTRGENRDTRGSLIVEGSDKAIEDTIDEFMKDKSDTSETILKLGINRYHDPSKRSWADSLDSSPRTHTPVP